MFKSIALAFALLATTIAANAQTCTSVADVYTEVTEVNRVDVAKGDQPIVLSTIDASLARLYAKAIDDMGGPSIDFDPTSIVVAAYGEGATIVFFKEGCAVGHLKIPYSLHVMILGRVQKSL